MSSTAVIGDAPAQPKPAEPPPARGLTSVEADARLRSIGPNILPSARRFGMLTAIAETVREPMLLLLLGTGVVYLVLGDLREAIAILASILLVFGISIVQRRRTERTLEALRDLTSPRALVLRDGEPRRIVASQVVPGDVVLLQEGDRVPADADVIDSVGLAVDESLLTGESLPVEKRAGPNDSQPKETVYSSSLIVRGHGVGLVRATGANTVIGGIGKSLEDLKHERTRLEGEIGRVVQVFGALGLTVCVIVVLAYGLLRGDWWQGALSALAVAISLVPEEFPVVLALFMVLGAWRIAQKKVLTRRLSAIETLGAATVICVDKTGTLTENRMQVRELQRTDDVSSDRDLLLTAAQASDPQSVDPIDKAICAAAPTPDPQVVCIREYPFDPASAFVAKAYPVSPATLLIAAKGAPEELMGRCDMTAEERLAFGRKLEVMASLGMRVIAVGSTLMPTSDLPAQKKKLHFSFGGLIGLADPLRPTVPSAIAELRQAGVRVAMVTGDYPGTAQNIAAQAGIPQESDVVIGSEMERADDAGVQSLVQRSNIFARIRPEQKLRIVQALKAQSEIVAMTGDGVNDAPALKAAHIGIAMGARGSDVAREASAVVLADDDFPAIAAALRLGRRIYDNLRKAVRYIIAAHIPIALLASLPVLFGWPLILTPLHIVFLELIVDPACSLAFEAEREEPDVMQRKPRPLSARLLDRPTVILGLVQGLGLFAAALAAFLLALKSGHGASGSRAMAFTTLVIGSLVLIWANRSDKKTVLETATQHNAVLWWLTGGAVSMLAVVLYLPAAREMFQFAPLSPHDVLLAMAFGGGSITWFELIKLFRGRLVGEETRAFARRIVLLSVGWVCVLLGLIGLVLPFLQGILLLAIGLLLLSAEYRFAQKLVRWLRLRYSWLRALLPKGRERAPSSSKRRTPRATG